MGNGKPYENKGFASRSCVKKFVNWLGLSVGYYSLIV